MFLQLLPTDLERKILSFLCKYCNKLKYLNKEFYNKYKLSPKYDYFSDNIHIYETVFKYILDCSFYKKCFYCYYIHYDAIKLVCKTINRYSNKYYSLSEYNYMGNTMRFNYHTTYENHDERNKKKNY